MAKQRMTDEALVLMTGLQQALRMLARIDDAEQRLRLLEQASEDASTIRGMIANIKDAASAI